MSWWRVLERTPTPGVLGKACGTREWLYHQEKSTRVGTASGESSFHRGEERRLAAGAEGNESRGLSGMRATGRLHIGHYFGALANWVRLQSDPAYECFYFIADWHALTSDYADTSAIAENTLQIMIDYLAAGLDPAKSVIFQQSVIPEHAELHLLLSMVTPLGWLERVPTYKEALENVKDKDLHNYGFLGYPILQCADIVIYSDDPKNKPSLFVPVGEDQVSHVEISREIVRRFKLAYADLILPNVTNEATWSGIASSSGIFSKVGPRILPDAPGSYANKAGALKAAFSASSLQEKGYYLANGLGELSDLLRVLNGMRT